MKVSYLTIGLLSLLTPLSAAWSKEDREIFRIRDEISAHEADPGATFYDILEIKSSASLDDVNKAYRAKTRALHPDKVKQQLRATRAKEAAASGKKEAKPLSKAEVKAAVKAADERYARLTLIVGILRGPSRDRYNHFVTNGFPLWKGTDYYYNRYRPGLGTVMFGLFLVVGGGVHYIILYMGWKRQKEFIGRYVKFARDTAWGPGMAIPGVDEIEETTVDAEEDPSMQALNRKQRRQMEKEKKSGATAKKARRLPATKTTAPDGTEVTKKRVVAENGKVLVVDADGNVFLEEQDEDGVVNEYLLDPEQLPLPTFKDTAVFRAPALLFSSTVGRFLPSSSSNEAAADDAQDGHDTPSSDSVGGDFEFLDKSTDSLKSAKTSGSQQGGKAKKRKGGKK